MGAWNKEHFKSDRATGFIRAQEIATFIAAACTPGEINKMLDGFQPEAAEFWRDMFVGKRLITGAIWGAPIRRDNLSFREMTQSLDHRAAGRVRDRNLDGLVAGKV